MSSTSRLWNIDIYEFEIHFEMIVFSRNCNHLSVNVVFLKISKAALKFLLCKCRILTLAEKLEYRKGN